MKNIIIFNGLLVLALCGCKNHQPSQAPPQQPEKKVYFPIADFLKGQIHYADSLPSAKLKVVTENGKSDSAYIHQDEFDQLAQEFLLPDLEQNAFEKRFKETAFIDQTTQTATFNYVPENKYPQLQRVDVLATPDELYSRVKSIFMQSSINKNDTIIVKKLFWQTNKHFQVITITQVPNQPKKIRQLTVTWEAGE